MCCWYFYCFASNDKANESKSAVAGIPYGAKFLRPTKFFLDLRSETFEETIFSDGRLHCSWHGAQKKNPCLVFVVGTQTSKLANLMLLVTLVLCGKIKSQLYFAESTTV